MTLRKAVFTVLEGFTLPEDARKILESAYYSAPELSDDQRRALLDSRDTAMRFTWQARIPECGEFAAIAQNLDWLCNDLNLNTD